MNKILWTVIALGLSTGAAFATTAPQAGAVSGNDQPTQSRKAMQTAMRAPVVAHNTVGQSSADHGTWFITRSDQYAHPPSYTGPVPVSSADHGTWFYLRSDQYAHPPHYAHAYHYAEANASRGTSNAYVTQSSSSGTWLFAPDPNAGANS